MLNKFEEKITTILGQAAAAASLVSSKAARDLQLLIGAARQEMHDELDHNWDRLDSQKISILRELDSSLVKLESSVGTAGKIEDQVYLDVTSVLSKLPFTKTVPSIRRVEGSTNYFREDGLYRVVITGSVFGAFLEPPTLSFADAPIDKTWLVPKPPNDLVINIPASALAARFQDHSLTYVPITISAPVPSRRFNWIFLRHAPHPATFTIQLELFPKYALAYRLTEYRREKVVDSAVTLIQKGPLATIPGCGNTGCNAYHNVCTDVPSGTQPVAIAGTYDSFQGWGGFGGQRITATGMCATYWQHSHNVARNVGFDVAYHPLKDVTVKRDLPLLPLTLGPLATQVSAAATSVGKGSLLEQISRFHLEVLKAIEQTDIVKAFTLGTQLSGPTAPYLRIGTTYSAEFNNEIQTFDLVIRSFTGEEFVITPAKNAAGPFSVSPLEDKTNFKRMTIETKLPWR